MKLLSRIFVALFIICQASSAFAYNFIIDNFEILKNGSLLFNDPFSDGNPPPNAPNFVSGVAGSYIVNGAPGPETGGKLSLDSANSQVNQNFTESGFVLNVSARLQTSTIGGASGLNSNSTFQVTGLFDLIIPDPSDVPGAGGDRYGIRLNDAIGAAEGDDIVDLRVVRRANGQLFIELRDINDPANTNLLVASISLDPNHEQIALRLSHLSNINNTITGSFAYVDGGVPGAFTTFAPTIDIYTGETWTRAQFTALATVATAPVPEPSTWLLFGSGLAVLARFSRNRFRLRTSLTALKSLRAWFQPRLRQLPLTTSHDPTITVL